jgi:hypothetical protein
VDLIENNQRSFKRKQSTWTVTIKLQSQSTRALDDKDFVPVASLDLSAAFNLVNTGLLICMLKVIVLPEDVIRSVEVWLKERSFDVSNDGEKALFCLTYS